MARKSHARPRSPEQIAAERALRRRIDFEAVGLSPEASALPENQSVEVIRAGGVRIDGKVVDNDVARRQDAFEALRPSLQTKACAGAYDAARRFERDILMSLGQHDSGRPVDRVDCEQAAFGRVDAVIDASKRVKKIRDRLSERDGWMLYELIAPHRPWTSWRAIVAHITAETNLNAQGAAVRAACVSLRDVYVRLDVASRKAA